MFTTTTSGVMPYPSASPVSREAFTLNHSDPWYSNAPLAIGARIQGTPLAAAVPESAATLGCLTCGLLLIAARHRRRSALPRNLS